MEASLLREPNARTFNVSPSGTSYIATCIQMRSDHTSQLVASLLQLSIDNGHSINQSITLMPGVARRAIHNRKQSQSVRHKSSIQIMAIGGSI